MDNKEIMTKKHLCMAVLAHVDAGKTTLSEGLLYLSGKIRKLGRVDNKDAYLDTNSLEKARGITIFSKQARFETAATAITLLDTPGHVDFSAEMERTLQVLDYAVLVVSGADGVQGHTKTLWQLLKMYHIPVFIFVNKMDQNGANRQVLLEQLTRQLSDNCVAFDEEKTDTFYEQAALCDEKLMNTYLETGSLDDFTLAKAIQQRQIFPCFFGSALKLEGVETLIQGIDIYSLPPVYPDTFGARVYKITRDEQGNRLTYMKITGGSLQVKETLSAAYSKEGETEEWAEKVNQIRLYSGEKYETAVSVPAGTICAVTGLTKTYAGEGLGMEKGHTSPLLEPVLSYQLILPDDCDPKMILPKLRQLEEEEPELHIVWDHLLQQIHFELMGEVQIDILKQIIAQRFQINVDFGNAAILYKETITQTVEGVGHFEPLRHYAEVHLLLEPGQPGSGLTFNAQCSEELLDKNWQRLILTHLEEKSHCGVLTGAPLTDLKITLVGGRAHKKHTEGGDFREATYRAVRQGLMQAASILLEPYYHFQLEVPEKMVGRAMTDVEKMQGTCTLSQRHEDFALLTGQAPVATMKNYQKEVVAYTKGHGKLFCTLGGYAPCHNAADVIAASGYEPEHDLENPTGSVFCSHGAGFLVPWYDVPHYMHVASCLPKNKINAKEPEKTVTHETQEETFIGVDEIDQIIQQTFYANQGEKSGWKKRKSARESYYETANSRSGLLASQKKYLLVDGYNVIFAWPELNELAQENMDGAKIKLLDALCNYQGMKQCEVMVVFDAYRVKGHHTEVTMYHRLYVVYTKEAETADRYIERFAHENHEKYQITVATSDGLEQIIIRGKNCQLLSARELLTEITNTHRETLSDYEARQKLQPNYLGDQVDDILKQQLTAQADSTAR